MNGRIENAVKADKGMNLRGKETNRTNAMAGVGDLNTCGSRALMKVEGNE